MPPPSKARRQSPAPREFPECPRLGVGGIVIDRGRVLLVRRGQEPLKGEWSIPGGLVEVGERLAQAVERETREETGVRVEPLRVLGVFERVEPAARGAVRYHYVVVDFLCRLRPAPRGSRRRPPHASSDVTEARWVTESELDAFLVATEARELIHEAFRAFGR